MIVARVLNLCTPLPPFWGQAFVFAVFFLAVPRSLTAPAFPLLFPSEQYLSFLLMPLFFGASCYLFRSFVGCLYLSSMFYIVFL